MIVACTDSKWDEYLQKMPHEKRDIYYTSQYYRLEQTVNHGEGLMFVYEEGDSIGIYPFIKSAIIHQGLKRQYYSIETAYGYGGPIVQSTDADFVKRFEEEFMKYCEDEYIIAEFVRFHPLLKNEHIFQKNIQVEHNRKTVWINLENDLEYIWMKEIAKQNRNTIRKCQKNKLRVEESSDYEEFIDIYNDTMQKVGADSFYFFDRSYYTHMKMYKDYLLLVVKQEKEVLAAAIFMGYGEYFHYHLSGSRKDSLKLAPNNILLWEAVKYAKSHGYKKMHLGGGLSDSMEDNLFRFKSRFSTLYADFYIGKRIHNFNIYNLLIKEWEEEHSQTATLFLQYQE